MTRPTKRRRTSRSQAHDTDADSEGLDGHHTDDDGDEEDEDNDGDGDGDEGEDNDGDGEDNDGEDEGDEHTIEVGRYPADALDIPTDVDMSILSPGLDMNTDVQEPPERELSPTVKSAVGTPNILTPTPLAMNERGNRVELATLTPAVRMFVILVAIYCSITTGKTCTGRRERNGSMWTRRGTMAQRRSRSPWDDAVHPECA